MTKNIRFYTEEDQKFLSKSQVQEKRKYLINQMIITLYNLGIEYEHLKDYENSLSYYKKGHQLALEELGQYNKFTQKLSESSFKIEQLLIGIKSKQIIRKKIRESNRISYDFQNEPHKSKQASFFFPPSHFILFYLTDLMMIKEI